MVIAIADPLVAGAIFAGFATTWRVFPPAKSLDDLESQLLRFRPSVALVGSSIGSCSTLARLEQLVAKLELVVFTHICRNTNRVCAFTAEG